MGVPGDVIPFYPHNMPGIDFGIRDNSTIIRVWYDPRYKRKRISAYYT